MFLKYCTSHMMVNDGIKSVPGSNSSTKLKMPPNAPLQPPNMRKKMIPDIGAQTRSISSPKKGTPYDKYPIKSMMMQITREGMRRGLLIVFVSLFCIAPINFIKII